MIRGDKVRINLKGYFRDGEVGVLDRINAHKVASVKLPQYGTIVFVSVECLEVVDELRK
jgi:hypothetical protein